jgi:hypothetical protein
MSVFAQLAESAYGRVKSLDVYYLPKSEEGKRRYKVHLEDIYKLLQSEAHYEEGLSALCHVCENPPDDAFLLDLVAECISSSRIFLYHDMLLSNIGEVYARQPGLLELSQRAYYSLDGELLLTRDQKKLYDLFLEKRKLVVSAPTSFGKSRIIREILAHNEYKSIVIVVPTNALLNETYSLLKSDTRLTRYRLVFSTKQPPDFSHPTIYIFTPEKFDLYSDENKFDFDLFIFDEIYKVDGGDDDKRSSVFANALYKAYKMECDYYLIGPYFKKFSPEFLRRTGGTFIRFTSTVVQKEFIEYAGDSVSFRGTDLPRRKGIDVRLRNSVKNLSGQSIVYVSSKRSAESKAKMLAKKIFQEQGTLQVNELIDYIKTNIADEWALIDCLKSGVAFHHAGIPKYIQAEIVDLFNCDALKLIVCTPTLIEGVNTTAKNVILYSNTKSDIPLSGFEIKNIVGRSGRFGHHFIGRAIFLEDCRQGSDIEEIKFPIFDYERLRPEDNIQIEGDDLSGAGREQRKEILKEIKKNGIPLELLKKNKYVSMENQIRLILTLQRNPSYEERLCVTSGLPHKGQVDDIVSVLYNFLFRESEQNDNWPEWKLASFIKNYLYFKPSLKEFIAEYDAVNFDTKVRNVLNLIYTYFEFLLPKYLVALENILNHVYETKTSYAVLITSLEYGSTKIQDILLADAGVPGSIIRKLSGPLDGVTSVEEIKRRIRKSPQLLEKLSNIERRMFIKRI